MVKNPKKRKKEKELKTIAKRNKKIKKLISSKKNELNMVSHLTRESEMRKNKSKNKLRLRRLYKDIEKEEEELMNKLPDYILEQDALKLEQEKKDLPNKLYGAARPAEEVYPEYYPEIQEAKEKERLLRESLQENLLEKNIGEYFEDYRTRPILGLYFELAYEKLYQSNPNNTKDVTSKYFKKVLDVDKLDHLGARTGYILSLIDEGDLLNARKVIEEQFLEFKPAEVSWTLLLIEYISFFILEEEGASADKVQECLLEALESNPYIGTLLLHRANFMHFLDPLEVDKLVRESRVVKLKEILAKNEKTDVYPLSGTCFGGIGDFGGIEEAMAYFTLQLSCWNDAEGAIEYVTKSIRLLANEEQNQDAILSLKGLENHSIEGRNNSMVHMFRKILKKLEL